MGGRLGGGRDGGGRDGGGNRPAHRASWAEMLGSTLPSGWNKNILEIVLEKDQRGAFIVSDHDCARVMQKLGLDQRPGVHVESVQICPNGRGVILITLQPNVPVANFCRHDIFEVTAAGVRAVNVKPAGKRDAVVTIKGLHYLTKFAKPITTKVIYGVFGEGPLKGLRNGDRSYKLEIKPTENIGTYHAIDGQKVTVRYPGQQQTCARCHETSRNCRGGGMARRCEAAGGPKVEFSDYILGMWKKIGYVPGDVEMAAVYDDHGDYPEQEGGIFTPVKQISNPDSFAGVSIRQIPRETDSGEIMELLATSGLPDNLKDNVAITANGVVNIINLNNAICLALIEKLHHQKHFGKKLFCNGIIPLTPEKSNTASAKAPVTSGSISPASSVPAKPAVPPPGQDSRVHLVTPPGQINQAATVASISAKNSLVCSPPPASHAQVSPLPAAQGQVSLVVSPSQALVSLDTTTALNSQSQVTIVSTPSHNIPIMSPSITAMLDNDFEMRLAAEDLVRRHSMSLRSPPPDSIASEILLSSQVPSTIGPHLNRIRSMLADTKDLNDQLSEFGSCRESSGSSSSDEENTSEREDDFNTVGGGKRGFKKRKNSTTPRKEHFLKKANTGF